MYSLVLYLCIAVAANFVNGEEVLQAGRVNSVVNSLLLDTPTPSGVNDAGEHMFRHATRMLAPSGMQVFYEYKATVKQSTVLLDNFVSFATVECALESLTLTIPRSSVRTTIEQLVDELNVRAGNFVHGDKTYGCHNADVNGPGPFYREIDSVSIEAATDNGPYRVTLQTTDTDPTELFSELEVDMKELPMTDADWHELAASPAVAAFRQRLQADGLGESMYGPYTSAAEEESRLFADHPEMFRLPLDEAKYQELRTAVSPADAMVLRQKERDEREALNVASRAATGPNGPSVSAVYFGADDATVYNVGDIVQVTTEHSGFPASGNVKVRVFGSATSWDRTESTFLTSFVGKLDDGIEFSIGSSLKTDVKLFADACFYTGAAQTGFSCSTASIVVNVCSLDDQHCKSSSDKIFVVDTHALFVVHEPASGEIAQAGKALTARLAFHGTKMEDVTVRLMRYRMLAFSDEVVDTMDLTLKPNMVHSLTFKPKGGIEGSIYPYFLQVKYNCGWLRCTKWNSYYFTVPRNIVADWSAKDEALVDIDCRAIQSVCSKASSFINKAQCNFCKKTQIKTQLYCKDCEVDGFLAVGGIRLRLLDNTEDRFMITVTGDYKASLDIKAIFNLAFEGTRDVMSASIPLAGIDFKVAGITFTCAVKLGVDLSVGFSLGLHGETRYTAVIDQPKFATVVKYGTHAGSAASAAASKTATVSTTLAGEGTATVTMTPMFGVQVSQIVDINIKLPLYFDMNFSAAAAGLPATTKRPDVIIKRGDCTGEHRAEYTGTAGVRKLVAHAEAKHFKSWLPKAWDWTLWDGNAIKLIHGCAFPFTSSLTRFRVAFAGSWDWEVPASFSDATGTRQFLGLVAEDFSNVVGAPAVVGRFLIKAITQYSAATANEEADAVAVALVDASAASGSEDVTTITVDLDSPSVSRLFTRLSSSAAAAAGAGANGSRRVAVVEVAVLEDDVDTPVDPKRRSAAQLRTDLQKVLSDSVQYPSSMIVKDTVCAPMLSCRACVASAQTNCAYCPTNGRCEASTTASACAKSFVTSTAKCPNEEVGNSDAAPTSDNGLPSSVYIATAAGGAALLLAAAIVAVVATKCCRAVKASAAPADSANPAAYVNLTE